MPTPGLSLVGAIDQQQAAFHHLRLSCIPADPSDAALTIEWAAAQAKRGAPVAGAGTPDIRAIPAPHDAYIQHLSAQPWVQRALQIFNYQAVEFRLVEIAPLLAFQAVVDTHRTAHHCAALNNPPIDELLPICLPLTQPLIQDIEPVLDGQEGGIILKARNLNARRLQVGAFAYNDNNYQSMIAGMQIHVALPFVHVVQFNGRCYLHNGYHRAYGVAKAGATHIPCMVRTAATQADAGIMPEGPMWQTFPLRILESADPPTMGHFINDRAHDVSVRSVSRFIHVTWTESVLPDEYERMKP